MFEEIIFDHLYHNKKIVVLLRNKFDNKTINLVPNLQPNCILLPLIEKFDSKTLFFCACEYHMQY